MQMRNVPDASNAGPYAPFDMNIMQGGHVNNNMGSPMQSGAPVHLGPSPSSRDSAWMVAQVKQNLARKDKRAPPGF
jgi:hypothetical protein